MAPPKKLSKHEVFRNLRLKMEGSHQHYLFTSFVEFPIKISYTMPLPLITYDHLQDLCNKSTAIYRRNLWPHSSLEMGPIKDYIYDKWSKGNIHKADVEFYNFFGKHVEIKTDTPSPATTDEIIAVHSALVQRLEESESAFETVGSTEALNTGLVAHLIYSREDRKFFKIKSLFRAIIIIIEESDSENVPASRVSLVRTGIEKDLAIPVSFEAFGEPDVKSVTVSLDQAVQVVMELEEAQEKALPNPRDPSALAFREGQSRHARRFGIRDEDVVGPSTGWIEEELSGKEAVKGLGRFYIH